MSIDAALKKLEQIAGGYLKPSTATKTDATLLRQLHSYFLTTGSFLSPDILTNLVLSYATVATPNQHPDLPILHYSLNSLLPSPSPLPFNVLLSHFANRRFPSLAFSTLRFMHRNSVPLDTFSLCSALTASLRDAFHFVPQVHSFAISSGSSSHVFLSSALIHSYAHSSLMVDARRLFDENPQRNTVCANALLSGYVRSCLWLHAFNLARELPELNLCLDHRTLLAILRACTGASAPEFGRQVHGYILRKFGPPGFDLFLQSSLLEMYGQCGLLGKACAVFDSAGCVGAEGRNSLDLVLWTSMLGVYGRSGHYVEVIELYKEMVARGIRPDEVSFVTVISACARTNQVELGVSYFKSMTLEYGLDPWQEHYSCLVDLLSRAGQLDEALDVICEWIQKGCEGSASVWGAMLNACFDCGHIELGKLAAERALEVDPGNMGVYMMLSNLYAKMGMWDEMGSLRNYILGRGLRKDKGCSWVEGSC
ncbi:hypothetical protein MLD38_027036 [Melastoma candidum]|uniref:Uncharacterized protein n=1 Tax=Melastoma candidum TaxID=119954 RepID=A0ACB9P070_9MYRT|nr:hypothetical protein MLD38_027036 [Melastoma candidum]